MRLFFFFFLFFVLFLVVHSQVASAKIAVVSDTDEVCFEPNFEKDIVYSITSEKDIEIDITKAKEFSKYLTLESEKASISANKRYEFKAHLKLPAKMDSEFEEVLVIFSPPKDADPDEMVGTTGIVFSGGSYLRIYKCYEEKHAFFPIYTVVPLRDSINFLATCKNNGNADIDELTVLIDVYDFAHNPLFAFNQSISITSGDVKTVTGTYPGKLDPGKYSAEYRMTYDGIESTEKVIKEFEIKEPKTSTTPAKKSSTVVAAPTMVAKQAEATADGAAPAEGFNWLLYIVLPVAILIVAGTLLFLRLRKK